METDTLKRRGLFRLLVFGLLLVAVCAVVSFMTASWVMRGKEWRHDQSHGHVWLHKELGLTESEAERIDAFEADYREQRQQLLADFKGRIKHLADILRTNDSFSDEVTHAVHQLHEVHGKLQNLAIEHYYEMLSVLPAEKQARLRELAVEALSEPE